MAGVDSLFVGGLQPGLDYDKQVALDPRRNTHSAFLLPIINGTIIL